MDVRARAVRRVCARAADAVDVDERGLERALRARGLRLGERVDQGAFAVVYKATSTGDGGEGAWLGPPGTVHAVKILSATASTVSTRRDFQREATLLTRVNHPSIVKVHYYDESPQPYMVTEFCTSGNLWNAMRAEEIKVKNFGDDDALEVPEEMPLLDFPTLVMDVADALNYLHTAGFAHRDIKTSNILLTWSSELNRVQAKLCDFGSAAPVSKMPRRPKRGTIERALGLGKGWQPVGTMLWMAPEMLRPPLVDEELAGFGGDKSDIYALGVVLWECLMWRIPWTSDGAPTRERVIAEVVDNATRLAPRDTTSAPMKALLTSMFRTIPAERPSAATVSSELDSMRRAWDTMGMFDRACVKANLRGREIAALLEGTAVEKETQSIIEEEARAVAGLEAGGWPLVLAEAAVQFADKSQDDAENNDDAVRSEDDVAEVTIKKSESKLTQSEEGRIRLTDIDPESWLGEPGTLDANLLSANLVNMIFPHILNAQFTPEMAAEMAADIEALQTLTRKFNDLKRRSRTDPFAALGVDAKGREVKRMTKKIERIEVEAQVAAWEKVRALLRDELKKADEEASSWKKELRRLR